MSKFTPNERLHVDAFIKMCRLKALREIRNGDDSNARSLVHLVDRVVDNMSWIDPDWQDINRIWPDGDRQLAVRLDCPAQRQEAA